MRIVRNFFEWRASCRKVVLMATRFPFPMSQTKLVLLCYSRGLYSPSVALPLFCKALVGGWGRYRAFWSIDRLSSIPLHHGT